MLERASAQQPNAWPAWKFGLNTVFFLPIAVATFGCCMWMVLRRMEPPGCYSDCRSELYSVAFWGLLVLCAVVFFGGIGTTVLLRRHSWAWLVLAFGLALIVIGLVVANIFADAAMLK